MQPNTQQNKPAPPAPGPVVNGAVTAPEAPKNENVVEQLRKQIEALEARLAAANKPKAIKANPNKSYTFDRKRELPANVKTTQVIALAKIIKKFDKDVMSETDLFAALDVAAEAKDLVTTQPPASIFRYYKSHLAAAGILVDG